MTQKDFDYRKLNEELEVILAQMDSTDMDVDEAIKHYQRGMEIVEQLEAYLKGAENKVQKIKQQWDTSA